MIHLLPRRWRQRFGTVSRAAMVRTRVPWTWRAVGAMVVLSGSVAGGLWIYDLGRQFAGSHPGSTLTERDTLRARVATLEGELLRLRALADSSDSRMQVERTAQGQLTQQVKALEADNSRLREELSFFENVLPGRTDERLSIQRFRVEESGVPGEYRYRLLVMNGGGKEVRDFRGSLQLVVNTQQASQKIVLTFPEPRASGDGYRLNFKRVQRVEGMFRVDAGAKVLAVQVRVLEQGSAQPRATESFTLAS